MGRAVAEEVAVESTPLSGPGDVIVVGPHWVICAQIEVALRARGVAVPVGCATPAGDDYAGWLPVRRWLAADSIVWVTDGRFGPPPELRAHSELRRREVRIERGGRVVRTFVIAVLTRRAQG